MTNAKPNTYSMVINASRRKDATGVQIEDKAMHFGKKSGAFIVNDPGVASEIEAQHGKRGQDVVVIHQPRRERGHKYFFGQMPEMPWKRKESANE